MSVFPKELKKIGFTVKERQGDWVITWEVIGHSKNGHNEWQEKRRVYQPNQTIASAIKSIQADMDYSYKRQLHNQIVRK